MPRDAVAAADSVHMGGLDAEIGFALRLAQVAVFKDLIAALRTCDLRPVDFSVLVLIDANPGVSQQAVGDALRIQKPNLVALLDALCRRHLVRRDTAPEDRRSYALYLTSAGTKLLAKAKNAHNRHTRKVRAAVGDDADVVLGALLRIADI